MPRVVPLNSVELTGEQASDLRKSPVYLLAPNERLEALLVANRISYVPLDGVDVPADSTIVYALSPLGDLVYISNRLLGPGGCPWDQAQTHESLKRYLLEEAYEVLDAIDSGDPETLKEELGDLILQPIMHAEMKRRAGVFGIDDVARTIVDKLVRRHPHVFGEIAVADADEVLRNWDQIKRNEKGGEPTSVLAGVPKGMASLLRAHEVSKRAARCGFEWAEISAVFDKLHEEEAELREAIESGRPERIESEIGDLLFTAVNLSRWAGVEPEEALRKMLNRFTVRFQYMERMAGSEDLNALSPDAWDELWNRAKLNTGQEVI